jgi:hypothetical protein
MGIGNGRTVGLALRFLQVHHVRLPAEQVQIVTPSCYWDRRGRRTRRRRAFSVAGQTKCSGNASYTQMERTVRHPFDQTILICSLDHFEAAYVTNPWTEQNFPNTYDSLAHRQ